MAGLPALAFAGLLKHGAAYLIGHFVDAISDVRKFAAINSRVLIFGSMVLRFWKHKLKKNSKKQKVFHLAKN